MKKYNKYTKNDLVNIIENIESILSYNVNNIDKNNLFNTQNDLESLIGTIPFLLQNREIFEKNYDIANFAARLGIFVPSPEKKKREDIIGRVIIAIAEFDNQKLSELNSAIKKIRAKSKETSNKNNFFEEWDKAIKDLYL